MEVGIQGSGKMGTSVPIFLFDAFSDTKYLKTAFGQFHFLSNSWLNMIISFENHVNFFEALKINLM